MAEESVKLRIPYIAAAQAQKHVTHNEAMTLLDTLVQLSVIDKDLAAPPGSPAEGDTYIVAADGAGAWIGWDKRIARFIDGTWRSYLPGEGDGAGWLAYVIDEETLYVFTGTDWEQLFVAEGHSGVSSVNGATGDVSLTLDDVDDVDAASPGDGHVLTWDDGVGAWVPAAPTGGDPVTLEPEGEWDSVTTYAKLAVVSYEGASYVSRIGGNTANPPDESPDEWMLLAAPGDGGNVNTTGAPVAAGNLVQYEDTSGNVIEDSGIAAANILVAADIGAAVQAYDADLAAVAALSANGLIARTGAGAAASRSVAVTASTGLSVTNGDGVSGNPTLAGLDATTSVKGVVELADNTETQAGTDTARAVTPAGLRSAYREKLTANRTYYVRTDGSDSNTGLADSSGGAFLTKQKAANVVYGTLDLGGFNVTIQVRDGTYTGGVSQTSPQVGAGTITFAGNTGTPANVVISTTSANCFAFSGFGTKATIQGFTVQTTTSGTGVLAQNGAQLALGSGMVFGACASFHISAENYGGIQSSSSYTITGNAIRHYNAQSFGFFLKVGGTVTLTGTPAFSQGFAFDSGLGNITAPLITFSGSATGPRYSAALNAIIETAGGGASYFPGHSAGSTASGGQYA